MKQTLIILLFLCILTSDVFSNAGAFMGSGVTLQLTNSHDIQMVSEEVNITPGRGMFLFDGMVSGMDRVEYYCKFLLRNLSDKNVTVKVGFPLDSQPGEPFTSTKDINELVKEYGFIAKTSSNTYHIDYVSIDKTKEFHKLFLWNMQFLPQETVELYVSYHMPISMAMMTTAKNFEDSRKYQKEWYRNLSTAMLETFSYVTKTGKSWAGKIEKAHFKVYVDGFEDYLNRRGLMEMSNEYKKSKGIRKKFNSKRDNEETEDSEKYLFSKDSYFIYRDIKPEHWIYKDGYVEWKFNNYSPEDTITFAYYFILGSTNNIQRVKSFIKTLWNDKPLKEDLLDLKEILMAYMGIPPKTKRVEEYVFNQIWYQPERKISEEELSKENKDFLMELDRLISENK